jgi:hypothetical protein
VSESELTEPQLITLTVPGELEYIGVVRLFVGGLAARTSLAYETMDDVQLAIESVLRKASLGAEVTLEARVDGDAVSLLAGPLADDPLAPTRAGSDTLELERLLSTLVAGAESVARDDGCWLRLDVRIPAGSGSA